MLHLNQQRLNSLGCFAIEAQMSADLLSGSTFWRSLSSSYLLLYKGKSPKLCDHYCFFSKHSVFSVDGQLQLQLELDTKNQYKVNPMVVKPTKDELLPSSA